jgi:hypothetical protein
MIAAFLSSQWVIHDSLTNTSGHADKPLAKFLFEERGMHTNP